ncbi:premelanosome protein b isoform X1 [Alosa alosa]|uniref:premelanosome protein b isoform X1 n=1 Tax=Alosa alosa TaxID=278164 RepID=UPI00201548A4|nr:premelanosome protein b isoform X1 [Alosa alosa]
MSETTQSVTIWEFTDQGVSHSTSTMKTLIAPLVLAVLATTAFARQVQKSDTQARYVRYHSWNTKMYPVWKHGDARYRNSWIGGDVTFDVSNDAPTLTGAKITFTIGIRFPANQKVLPDGEVVWAENCTVDGKQYYEGQPVYPEHHRSSEDLNAVFPDGVPLRKDGDKKPPYVFVWKTWGQYWQVSDGPSSSLTITTDNIPLGSYTMDVVIYHYRKRDKFIPIGYASTQFCITDQIPFEVVLSQVNDIQEDDQRFVQNRAVVFSISLHDPSEYLSTSDVTFNWDFGDGSGTVISRETTVTHTYIQSGSFRPKMVVQAAIPDPSCATPANAPTMRSPTTKIPAPPAQDFTTADTPAEPKEDVTVPAFQLSSDLGATSPPSEASAAGDEGEDDPPSVPVAVELEVTTGPADSVEDMNDRAASINPAVDSVTTVIPVAVVRVGTERRVAEEEETGVNSVMDAATTAPTDGAPQEDEDTDPQQVAVVITKRYAHNDDCLIYRYGSFSTGIEIVEGIESVEIVQVSNAVLMTETEPNAVDFTITCRGSSLPTEVCTVVSDANCVMPVKTICNPVPTTPDCQLVLRQFFNDSGIFCVNVSMTNDVSLAVTSTRVSVNMGSKMTSTGTVAMVLGVLIVASAVGTVAFTYRRLKGYRPLTELPAADQQASGGLSSFPALIWSLLSGHGPGDNRTLLRRVV